MWALFSKCLSRKTQFKPPPIESLSYDPFTDDERPNPPRTPSPSLRKPLSLSCSSDDSKVTENARKMRTSHAMDGSRVSFLDLPAELRNNIYSRLLIVEGYVRVMRVNPTVVPALVLLRTCKQVHDEVASIFYAANSFFCRVAKPVVILKSGPGSYLDIPTLYIPSPDTDPKATQDWELWSSGGIFFPAPQYHVWLTRVTVDATFFLSTSGIAYENKHKVLDCVEEKVIQVFEQMTSLWQKKDRKWEGRLQGGQRHWSSGIKSWTVTFAEAEHEETATKTALRRWDVSR